MAFAAYQSRHDGTDFSFEGRDEAAGILGQYKPGDAAPVLTAQTLEGLKQEARAYLGKEPGASLYLTDAENRVHGIMINEKHHVALERAERHLVISVALLIFCATCLVAASAGVAGKWALLGFVSTTALYALILRMRLFNVIEGAACCEILLILTMFSLAALH
jgi:hypothetical protein